MCMHVYVCMYIYGSFYFHVETIPEVVILHRVPAPRRMLGICLYMLVCGKLPFEAEASLASIARLAVQPLPTNYPEDRGQFWISSCISLLCRVFVCKIKKDMPFIAARGRRSHSFSPQPLILLTTEVL